MSTLLSQSQARKYWSLAELSVTSGMYMSDVPGYVTLKHSLPGLETDDWIALDEGSWFYMPTLYPAASFSQAMETLQTQDTLIREIPEVANVLGKIGRVESALDPAPAAMIETYVMLKPEHEWDAVTFLEHTCLKAGLPSTAWEEPEADIYIFSANVFGEAE